VSLFHHSIGMLPPKIVKKVSTLMDLKVSVALGEGIGYLTSEICTSSDAYISFTSKTLIIMQNLA